MDETSPLVDELGDVCTAYGLDFRIDKNRLKYGDLISSFMDELGNNDDIILIFSHPYFKSRYCMYELLQIWKKGSFQQRVHPILIDGVHLDNIDFQLDIIQHWNNEAQNLQEKLNGYHSGSTVALRKWHIIYSEISHEIGNLLDFSSKMLFISTDNLRHQKFKPLLERINPESINNTEFILSSKYNEQVRKISEIKTKDVEIKEKMSEIDREMTQLESMSDSEHDEIIEWLSKYNENHVEKIYSGIIKKYGNLFTNENILATEEEMLDFKLDISLLIERLETCLFNERVKILNEPHIYSTFNPELYKLALVILLERVPSYFPEKSKQQFECCISYLINRIDLST
ncbi:MAG: hypothetical protein BWK73_32325 [Thiothrix lacustris]|uniref:TIR domain-containing protein n=1 Tax=Thiothrix lacustris TaxID=525917 RepID=A0A1Y1QI47_9GAMM|nr:MAG: hypothetical protein BWK73_32325 [Thiothrix lacustris]